MISHVTFKKLTDEVIRDYHSRSEPLDKAGAVRLLDALLDGAPED